MPVSLEDRIYQTVREMDRMFDGTVENVDVNTIHNQWTFQRTHLLDTAGNAKYGKTKIFNEDAA